ncbi:hypothetical protein [Alkalicoccobacillus plakortidis]|uniref:Uncharacterized protein n=1 Tax=Alkalicoccobacillus plakortidis TaxID=444060 RepID=A0ABT0XQ24_9BACI|nr:hypothetical protein [Alkalicoccobacillus plakortidis]MCM2678008.1 hypothetical protein [Alkalicoccobacillus plakortidis]
MLYLPYILATLGGTYLIVFILNGILDTLFGLEPSIKKWALSSAVITIIILLAFNLFGGIGILV